MVKVARKRHSSIPVPSELPAAGHKLRSRSLQFILRRYGWLPPLILALGVNANVLLNGWVWDDHLHVGPTPHATMEIVSPATSAGAFDRPLVSLSYRIDRWIWGSAPFGFHLSVYLGHALTVLLFYLSVQFLLRLYHKEESVAVLSAALFAVHPVHAEAVAWIGGRNDILMSLFAMVALYAYLRNIRAAPPRVTIPVFLLGCSLSLMSKETAFPFLLLFPVLGHLFRRAGIRRRKGGKAYLGWLAMIPLVGFSVIRVIQVGWPPIDERWISAPFGGVRMGLVAVGYYFRLLVIPVPMNAYVPEFPGGTVGRLDLLLGGLGLLFLLWILFRKSRTLFAVGAAWFLLGIAGPLAVPLTGVSATPAAERYVYLASGGLFILFGLAAWEGRRWLRARIKPRGYRRWLVGFSVIIVGLFSYLTMERNAVWRNDITLWEDTVRKSPAAAAAYNHLGRAYHEADRAEDAGEAYRTALKLKPDFPPAYNNLGRLLADQGRSAEAFRSFEMALTLDPDDPSAHYNLGSLLADQGLFDQAAREYQTAIRLSPDFAEAYDGMGSLYAGQGNLDRAVEEFQHALELKPDRAETYYNLGEAYMRNGRTDMAITALERALELEPDFGPAAHRLHLLRPNP